MLQAWWWQGPEEIRYYLAFSPCPQTIDCIADVHMSLGEISCFLGSSNPLSFSSRQNRNHFYSKQSWLSPLLPIILVHTLAHALVSHTCM